MTTRRRLRAVLLAFAVCAIVAAFGAPAALAQPQADCPPPAAAPSPAQQASAAADARDRGFLWRISKDGRSSHLYGTVHLARFAWTLPGPRVAAALGQSDVLALELDLDDAALLRRLMAGMAAQRADAATLPAALDARLRGALANACLPPTLLDLMAPEMAVTTLMVMSARGTGLDPAWAIDPALARAARALGKPVLSLESPEQQLALLHSESADAAREEVEHMLDALGGGELRTMLLRITEVWAESRYDELTRYLEWCDCVGSERERAKMAEVLDGRNPGLANGIDALHRAGQRVFAAVGSLHMIGPNGLPALLAARGYAVERIEFER